MGRLALRLTLLAALVGSLGGPACTGAAEQPIVSQFFSASRLRDNTALDNLATVVFDPRTQGTVTSFTIQSVSPERRKPLSLKALAQAQDEAKAEDVAFSKRKEEYQNANLDAIQRVIQAERASTKLADRDLDVQAAWTKFRDESTAMAMKVAEARRSFRSESRLADLSVNFGSQHVDVASHEGEIVSKDVTISAPVRLPSGETVQKTLIVTMQRAVLKREKGGQEIGGRWIVTVFKDASASAGSLATPRS